MFVALQFQAVYPLIMFAGAICLFLSLTGLLGVIFLSIQTK